MDRPTDLTAPPAPEILPLLDLRDTGLLWLINRSVFHPIGLALGFAYDDDGRFAGWCLFGDGSEPMRFDDTADHEFFAKAMATLDSARNRP